MILTNFTLKISCPIFILVTLGKASQQQLSIEQRHAHVVSMGSPHDRTCCYGQQHRYSKREPLT